MTVSVTVFVYVAVSPSLTLPYSLSLSLRTQDIFLLRSCLPKHVLQPKLLDVDVSLPVGRLVASRQLVCACDELDQ